MTMTRDEQFEELANLAEEVKAQLDHSLGRVKYREWDYSDSDYQAKTIKIFNMLQQAKKLASEVYNVVG